VLARCIAQSGIGKMAIHPAQIESINEISCPQKTRLPRRARSPPRSNSLVGVETLPFNQWCCVFARSQHLALPTDGRPRAAPVAGRKPDDIAGSDFLNWTAPRAESAAPKKGSAKSNTSSQRKVPSIAATAKKPPRSVESKAERVAAAKTPVKIDQPQVERVTKQERVLTRFGLSWFAASELMFARPKAPQVAGRA
jgi:hypothetical protein